MVGFPPCASNFGSKNKLKSPAIISCFFGFVSSFSNSTNMLLSISICSFSGLALYKLIKVYSKSLIETSRIKMRPSLLVSSLLTKNVSVPKQAIWTPEEFVFPWKKKNLTFKVLFPFLFDFTVRVSFLQKQYSS